jgi:hypothetical protein
MIKNFFLAFVSPNIQRTLTLMSLEIFYGKIREFVKDPVQIDISFHCWLSIVFKMNIIPEIFVLNVKHRDNLKDYVVFHCFKGEKEFKIIPFPFVEETDAEK